jgi:hypothetical protein
MFDEGPVLPQIVAIVTVSAVAFILIVSFYGWG